MASNSLSGVRVAILATDGFEQSELLEPRKVLGEAGAKTWVISPKEGKIRGWNHTEWGQEVAVDGQLASADSNAYDALVLPGGVMNPDTLRTLPEAVAFLKTFMSARKPVAAICHGPWLLVESGDVAGYRLTSWPSLKTDIRNAGGDWVDEEVVIDRNLITSRKPGDLPAFDRELVGLIQRTRRSA
ncbi:MAG: type 1 glutamine amidotransferase domain-containing protein [Steroidobacteraceae bacterium]